MVVAAAAAAAVVAVARAAVTVTVAIDPQTIPLTRTMPPTIPMLQLLQVLSSQSLLCLPTDSGKKCPICT